MRYFEWLPVVGHEEIPKLPKESIRYYLEGIEIFPWEAEMILEMELGWIEWARGEAVREKYGRYFYTQEPLPPLEPAQPIEIVLPLKIKGIRAWTFPPFLIIYFGKYEEGVMVQTRIHEWVHIFQARRVGLFFPISYLYYLLRYGYNRNPFEVEARKAESRVRKADDYYYLHGYELFGH